MECNTGQVLDLGGLYHRFERLEDKRHAKRKRYALATILVGMFLAKLCGEDKPSGIAEWVTLLGEWIARVLGLRGKACPATIRIAGRWQTILKCKNLKHSIESTIAIVERRISSDGFHGWKVVSWND